MILQVTLQAASVAVDSTSITHYAEKARLTSQRNIADLWTNGSLGDKDGLPDRKTRIYIGADMARPAVHTSKDSNSESVSEGAAPAKKKRKGKAERNRLKKEQEQALVGSTAAVLPKTIEQPSGR